MKKDLLPRHLLPLARLMLEDFPGLIIEGARQVGKSTLAGMLAPDAGVYNLDREADRAAAIADPELIVSSERTVVIDEVQRVPSLTLAVKASIDLDRRPGRFVLTGSASLLRVQGLVDSLVGRVSRLTLFGFSQGEIAGRTDDFAATAFANLDNLMDFRTEVSRDDYAKRLEAGGFPDVCRKSERARRQWFDSYLDGTVYRDLPELRREYDPNRGFSVLRVLAANPAGELVPARLARDTGIPAGTITGYLDLWRSVGLVTTIPSWTPNLTKRETGKRKAFLSDSGLALRTTRLTATQLLTPENLESFGSFLEAFVAAELLRQRTWSDVDFELFHYRDRDGIEVDLIIEATGGGILAIEVKASTSFRGDQFNALRKLRDQVGTRFVAGIVLNTGFVGYRYADRLFGLPIAALWELA